MERGWNSSCMLRIMGLTESTSVNGPGNRCMIHLQGCTLGCDQCFNPQSHPHSGGKEMSVHDVVAWVKNLKDIEGVVLSGGEPLQQAGYLYLLLSSIRQERPDLTINIYCGYSIKELESGKYKWKSHATGEWVKGTPELWNAIKGLLDFGVFGRYNKLIPANEPLRSSLNQEVVFFTDKYSGNDLKPQMIEVQVDPNGLTTISGFPTVDFRRGYGEVIESKPITKPNGKDDQNNEELVCA